MERWMRFCKNSRVKLACILVFTVAVVTCVGSLQWFLNYMYDTNQNPEVIFENYNQGYYETTGFQSEFSSAAAEITRGIMAKELLETDGKLDEKKIVDLKQFYEDRTIDGKTDCGLSYTVGDLLNIGEEQDMEENWESIYVCTKKKVGDDGLRYEYVTENEFNTRFDNEYNGDRLEEYGSEDAIYDKEGSLVYTGCWPLEIPVMKIHPQEGNWLDVFNTDPDLNGSMSDYRDMLTSAASIMWNYYSYYEQGNVYEDETRTNIQYFLYNGNSKRLYSNNPQWQDPKKYESCLEEIQKQEIYVSKDKNGWTSSFDSRGSSTYYPHMYEIFEETEWIGRKSDWSVGFAIDPDMAADDIFANQATLYGQYAAEAEIMRVVLGISIAAVLLSVIILTFGLGMSSGGVIDLFTFDKLKTEIAAVIIVGVWGIFFGTGAALISSFKELMESYVFWAAMVSIPSAVFFLIGYASLLKRIHSHTLWSNSLCCIVFRWMKKLFLKVFGFLMEAYRNLNQIWKDAVIMAAIIFLHWIAMADDSGFFIFLALIAEMMVVIVVIRRAIGQQKVMNGLRAIVSGKLEQKIDTTKMKGAQKEAAELLNHVEDGLEEAIQKQMKSERMKTELITNVSHDIKTPLTSIINYVDLLKRETADPDKCDQRKVAEYLEVLEQKSQRLKILTEDVVEASKISSGNIVLENTKLDLVETLIQIEGEYSEKLSAADLTLVKKMAESPVTVYADGRRVWRVIGNLYQNVAKYAMPGTRIYVSLEQENGKATFTMKNISKAPLNIDADELTERFIRGDESRTTEGSGLGLSIAKSLTEAMNGKFEIYLDGDLFKVIVQFPLCV